MIHFEGSIRESPADPPAPELKETFRVIGDIDIATAPVLEVELLSHALATVGPMVLDCSEMSFLDARGIAVFASLQRDLDAAGRRLILTNVRANCRKPIEVCGLVDLLDSGRLRPCSATDDGLEMPREHSGF